MSFHSTLHIENPTGLVRIDIWGWDSREKDDDLIPKSNSSDLSPNPITAIPKPKSVIADLEYIS